MQAESDLLIPFITPNVSFETFCCPFDPLILTISQFAIVGELHLG